MRVERSETADSCCPLCGRDVPRLTIHHLVPRSRGGRGGPTVEICPDCHDAIHELFSNKELAADYASLEALRGEERLARHLRWLSKQNPERRFSTRRARSQRRRGRNG